MSKKELQPIIIKKKKGHGHAAHGGAWKVAYADFVTAMMAFFLLLWLLGSTTPEEQRYISGYFQDPGGTGIGSGGTSPGIIPRENPVDQPTPSGPVKGEFSFRPGQPDADGMSSDELRPESVEAEGHLAPDELNLKALREAERQKLEALKQQLEQTLKDDPVFALLKDQVLIDIISTGLRIQIIDKENRPSFDLGSPRIKNYTAEVLQALAPIIDKVPNRLSITGHTDATPYAPGATYTNWELSSDRANAARRELLAGGIPSTKVAKVEGFGDAVPFRPEAPMEPINRRIAIIVLKKEVDEEMSKAAGVDSQVLIEAGDSAVPPTPETTPAAPAPTPAEPVPGSDPGAAAPMVPVPGADTPTGAELEPEADAPSMIGPVIDIRQAIPVRP